MAAGEGSESRRVGSRREGEWEERGGFLAVAAKLQRHAAGLCCPPACPPMPPQFPPPNFPSVPPCVPPAPSVRWVHADPLTGWVGRERDVEANVPRERQPLAYVVALADGGAKDVTQRWGGGHGCVRKVGGGRGIDGKLQMKQQKMK